MFFDFGLVCFTSETLAA